MSEILISADPGTSKAGVALYTGPAPAVALIKGCKARDVGILLDWASAKFDRVVLVVEDQHVKMHPGRDGRPTINWPSVKALVLAADRWVVMAEDLGLETHRVLATEWQGAMFRSIGRQDEQGKNLSTKQMAQRVAVATWPQVLRFTSMVDPVASATTIPSSKITQDMADAAVMGRWWQLHGRNAHRPGPVEPA